ncbi:MAG: sugar ABC transporter permease [Clostridiales bacterium]|nr:sugar ABC transporter permease [Clostridiales bacterium]
MQVKINKKITSQSDKAKRNFWGQLMKQKELQIMVIIGMLFIIVFRFVPIYGIQLAFKELLPGKGIWDSPWVGMKHYKDFFYGGYFSSVMYNTIMLSFLRIILCFPVPIIFALLLNEIKSSKSRSLIQGISYLPHFLSWVIVFGVISSVFSRDTGVLNGLLMDLGIIEKPIHFFGMPKLFWPLMIITDIWKNTGWNAIIYMAAIAGIDPQLYESAVIDGANRFKQVIHITIPLLMPTIVILLILRVGAILDAGFDQILVFRNPIVYEKANVIDIYVYDVGLLQGRYSYATAVGLFKSVVGFILIWISNYFANKQEMGIW